MQAEADKSDDASSREVAEDVDSILSRFDGDARAALCAALDDIAFLRREIEFAALAMSYGFTRGWRPALERTSQPLDG
ncbi:MAG: hypothetical protein KJZ83_06880 [Burkholderiaceae bacterium]|nr:hypothetical protein [Burkholderiaceae bacterium]